MKAKIKFAILMIIGGNLSVYSQQSSGDVYSKDLLPQINQQGYIDIAKSNVTDGVLFRAASISTLTVRSYHLQTGFLFSYSNQKSIRLNGSFLNLSGSFRIKKVLFEATLFYRNNPFSAMIHETNWGFMLACNSRHLSITLGDNYRIYKFTINPTPENNLKSVKSIRIVEPRNIMYSFTYFVMPIDHKWNASLTITNFDYFLIQQETNPMGACKLSYKLTSRLLLYSELWYQCAGVTNLQANYFGVNIRTGFVWKIN